MAHHVKKSKLKNSQKKPTTPSTHSRASTTVASRARSPEIRTVMLPRDTNYLGTIFGGHILSLIDLAAGQHARAIAPKKYVTKIMREVNFIAPVHVGDVVSFYCTTVAIGRTSITIRVDVEALRVTDGVSTTPVTSAEIIMVAVDKSFKPIAVM